MTDQEKIDLMKDYLLLKFEEEDWHGVADAAMDLRELLAKIKTTKALKLEKLRALLTPEETEHRGKKNSDHRVRRLRRKSLGGASS